MRLILVLLAFVCSCTLVGQRTTIVELGKIDDMSFSLATSDTLQAISITQSKGYGSRIVVINNTEISEVIKVLDSFIAETNTKPVNTTVISHKTVNLLLTCNYFKGSGWIVMIQNTDPAFEQTSNEIKNKTGYDIYHFIEIKPKHLADVIKIFTKAK